MTSELKCPVCNRELVLDFAGENYFCDNSNCVMDGVSMMQKRWESLIQIKEKLDDYKHNLSVKTEQHERGYAYAIKTIRDLESKLEIARNAADNSREKLAAFMHDTWGNWFAYQLKNSTVENLQRWGIQSNTPYSSLTETDKDKDRKFADKIIEIIKEQIDHFADVSKMIEHKQ